MNEKIKNLINERRDRNSNAKDYINSPGILINIAIDDLESLLEEKTL